MALVVAAEAAVSILYNCAAESDTLCVKILPAFGVENGHTANQPSGKVERSESRYLVITSCNTDGWAAGGHSMPLSIQSHP